ncbi:MAG: diaminopimelate decarboxylase [Solirubrobacterales bacterium]|jgi:diaminopimelate decarboxylase|nr:diaminopimelate decarboxylase [Solirubrobacterales bacterium]
MPGAQKDAAAAVAAADGPRHDPVAASSVYPQGSRVNEHGHLEVGGCDVVELLAEHGSPAYIYAEDDIRARAGAYLDAFSARSDDFEVLFASKALPCTAAYATFAELGLSVDVASGGELAMALAGGFDPARIYMHGNNKTEHELREAIAAGVGHLIVDSFDEIERLERLLAEAGASQDVMIRVTPGIKASTHSYVQTGQLDSKFGFGIEDGLAEEAVRRVVASERLTLVGLHAHIGSQIFELEPYTKAIEVLADFSRIGGFEMRIVNVGGGLGIAYTAEDEPPSIEDYVDVKVRGVERVFDPVPRILIEPGRSLVGNAGVTAYTVGTVKQIPGVRTYVAVDGGMSDNLRPMLYGSRYEALIANRAGEPAQTPATIAGMHCESGDILVRDTLLAEPAVGDVLVTPATGAYGYSMANNYNGVPRPPVIFCRDGRARVVVRRETYADLMVRDA